MGDEQEKTEEEYGEYLDPVTPKKWIGVGLDGTLAVYKGDISVIGEPIAPMVERVKGWMSWYDRKGEPAVRILTPRVCPIGRQYPSAECDRQREMIAAWCREHLGHELEAVYVRDSLVIEIWDHKAREVTPNQGMAIRDIITNLREENARLREKLRGGVPSGR